MPPPRVQIYCEVEGCKHSKKMMAVSSNKQGGNELPSSVSFFPFPSDPLLGIKWKTACRVMRVRSAFSHVCSQHFKPHELKFNGKKLCLIEGSIPSINLFPSVNSISSVRTMRSVPVSFVRNSMPSVNSLNRTRTVMQQVKVEPETPVVTPVKIIKCTPQRTYETSKSSLSTSTILTQYARKISEQENEIMSLKKAAKDLKKKLIENEKILKMNSTLHKELRELKEKLKNYDIIQKERDYFIKKSIEEESKSSGRIVRLTNKIEYLQNQLLALKRDQNASTNVDIEKEKLKEIRFQQIVENRKLLKANRALCKENFLLKDTLNQDISKDKYMISRVKTIFNSSQIRILRDPYRSTTTTWLEADLDDAIKLYNRGHLAYSYLVEKGFPLPRIDTIKARINTSSNYRDHFLYIRKKTATQSAKRPRLDSDSESCVSIEDVGASVSNKVTIKEEDCSDDYTENAIDFNEEPHENCYTELKFEIKEEID